MKNKNKIALGALALYVGAIVLANYLIVHGLSGATATPYGTYTLPTLFGLVCPAGTYMAAVTFPLRDLVQRSGGRTLGIVAILLAALVSWWVSSPSIAIASGGTFLISESLDFLVYTPLQHRWFVPAVVASGVIAAVADSLIFLQWSGIGYGHGELAGLIVAKLLVVTLVGGPLAFGFRKLLPTRLYADDWSESLYRRHVASGIRPSEAERYVQIARERKRNGMSDSRERDRHFREKILPARTAEALDALNAALANGMQVSLDPVVACALCGFDEKCAHHHFTNEKGYHPFMESM